MPKVFMSHTKLDKFFCDDLDVLAAREGLDIFRSEFEVIDSPAWKTIKKSLASSSIMFLMVGSELIKAQELSSVSNEISKNWKFTQNWISYEVGLACQLGIDVWVICDSVKVNFPIPYFNNYVLWGLQRNKPENVRWWRTLFRNFKNGITCPVGAIPDKIVKCGNCGVEFNLHSSVPEESNISCPTCLHDIYFEKGF